MVGSPRAGKPRKPVYREFEPLILRSGSTGLETAKNVTSQKSMKFNKQIGIIIFFTLWPDMRI